MGKPSKERIVAHVALRGVWVFVTLACCCWPFYAQAVWHGKQDNKPVAELERMSEGELVMEAYFACSNSAIAANVHKGDTPVPGEAAAYLAVIERVARKKQKGTSP